MTSNKIISVSELWQFYNLSANLICIAGNSGYFNHINASFVQLLRFTEEELLSIPYLDLIHPDEQAATLKEINELKRGKPFSSFLNRCKMKSGNYKRLSWTANCSGADGNIYAIGLDCTDKVMLQDEIIREKKITETISVNKKSGLIDNIKKLIEDTRDIQPLEIKFYSQNFTDDAFDKILELNILSIVDEQLKSILKHSQATSVQINLEQIDNNLFLSIQDNGTGFNKTSQQNGAGISNIINSAKQFNGEVFIDIAPGKGYTLSVVFVEPGLILN